MPLDLTLTPIESPTTRECLERAGDVSASLVEPLTYDEIRTLCGNVERDAERGDGRHVVPTALLFRLLRTALTGPREEAPLFPATHTGDGRTIERGYEDGLDARTRATLAEILGVRS